MSLRKPRTLSSNSRAHFSSRARRCARHGRRDARHGPCKCRDTTRSVRRHALGGGRDVAGTSAATQTRSVRRHALGGGRNVVHTSAATQRLGTADTAARHTSALETRTLRRITSFTRATGHVISESSARASRTENESQVHTRAGRGCRAQRTRQGVRACGQVLVGTTRELLKLHAARGSSSTNSCEPHRLPLPVGFHGGGRTFGGTED
jgi:hypothetical protein